MSFKKISFALMSFLVPLNISFAKGNIRRVEQKTEKINNTDNITLMEILEFTFKNNDLLNAEREKTKAIQTLKTKTLGANAFPRIGIDLNYGYTDFDTDLDGGLLKFKFSDTGILEDNKIYLQQPIFKSGRTTTQVKAVNNQIDMQKNILYQTEQKVLFDTIQAVVLLLQSKEILNITIKNEESLKKSYEYIKARRKVGRGTISDLSLAEARYNLAKSDTIMANTNYSNAKSIFFKVTKIDPNVIDVKYDEIFKTSFNYSIKFDDALESALEKNPQYQIAKSNYEMNRNILNYSKTTFLPEVYLNAQWGRSKTTDIITQTSGSVSLNVKIPLFQSGVEYASHRQAGHLLNESKFTLNDVKDTLINQTMITYDEFISSKSLVSSSKSYMDASKVALDSVTAEEKTGRATIVDILDRRREYFLTEISFLKNKTNVISYYYSLKLLMGELNLNDL